MTILEHRFEHEAAHDDMFEAMRVTARAKQTALTDPTAEHMYKWNEAIAIECTARCNEHKGMLALWAAIDKQQRHGL